jgi:hypothetical protein
VQVLTRLIIAMMLLSAGDAAADKLQLAEQEIKAGLLYNFLKYTGWPQTSIGKPLVVCVFGEDPLGGALQPMATRTVNQRAIALRFMENITGTDNCDLLFINAGNKAVWPELKMLLSGKPVLTVSDFDGFSGSGGMIEFSRKESHIQVLLNMHAVIANGLRVEERLLKLVTVVNPGPGSGE